MSSLYPQAPGQQPPPGPPPSYSAGGGAPPPPMVRRGSGDVTPGAPTPPRQEIKLYSNAAERRKFEDLADIYSIIKAVEHLEGAFARDAILPDEYTAACSKLLAQFKSTEAALKQAGIMTDTRTFMAEYHMECPRAVERFQRGVPATVTNPIQDDRGEAVKVAETVQHFITAMDAVKLEQTANDELQPLLSDLMTGLTRVPGLPADFPAIKKMQEWLALLNGLKASESITAEQSRQMLFDLDTGYSDFHRWLRSKDGNKK